MEYLEIDSIFNWKGLTLYNLDRYSDAIKHCTVMLDPNNHVLLDARKLALDGLAKP